MAIKNIQTVQTGLVGVLPSLAYIFTTDPEATIITTGYLNHEVQLGTQFSMPCIAAVSTMATPTSQPQVGWYQVAHVGENWSLVAIGSPGDVVLPTIANHIATYTNTTGTLSEDAATAINGGNIQAGLSGTAGYLATFPSAAAKGSFRIVAVANTGDTLVTLSNVLMGQASVISIPDPANAVGRLLIGATATPFVSGNIPAASGTGGLMVDSGKTAASLATFTSPTIANHIAVFSNTSGNLGEDASTAINGGSLQAGLSGTAGTLISFPATATNGSLIVAATNAGGAFNTTISNGTMGQSTVYSMGDIGASTGGLVVATTAIRMKSVAGAAAAGGAAAQSFSDAFCTSGSNVVGNWNTQANAVSVLKIVPGNGSFVVTSSGDAGVGTFNYIITK